MIIVSGLLADDPVRLVCSRLILLGYKFVFLDDLTYPDGFHICQNWSEDGNISGYLKTKDGQRIDFDEVTGVYIRYSHFKWKKHLQGFEKKEKQLITSEKSFSRSYLFDYLPCTVLNPLWSMVSNDSKPFQSVVAQSFGFNTPATLITSVPEEVFQFYNANGGEVIYKPIGGTRSIVRALTKEDLDNLKRLKNCPVQFQQYIKGPNVRVHVVGEAIFAVRILSKAVDYRYAADRFEKIQLPTELEQKCIAISRYLGLNFAGIDLIDQDGEYFFLEANPSPGFSFYEYKAYQPISEAIATLLKNGKSFFQRFHDLEKNKSYSWMKKI